MRCALAHAQFETLPPFLDGIGRVGRLLITLMLCEEGALSRPLLYLSLYLKARRAEYCDRITAIRQQGHGEQWLAFFLRGVSVTACDATQTAQDIVALREAHRGAVAKNARALALLDHLLRQPTVSVNCVAQWMGCTFPAANKLVRDFEARGWLREPTGYGRNRLWSYQPYLDLFHCDTLDALVDGPAAVQVTGSAPLAPVAPSGLWAHLAGATSTPFAAGTHQQIAVKVIDDRGNELMMVKKLEAAK